VRLQLERRVRGVHEEEVLHRRVTLPYFDIEFSLFLPLIFESINVGVVVSVVFFAILINISLIHELNESTLE